MVVSLSPPSPPSGNSVGTQRSRRTAGLRRRLHLRRCSGEGGAVGSAAVKATIDTYRSRSGRDRVSEAHRNLSEAFDDPGGPPVSGPRTLLDTPAVSPRRHVEPRTDRR